MQRASLGLLVVLVGSSVAAPHFAAAAAGEPWRVHALVGARVVVAPGKTLPSATIILRDGVIEAVGEDLAFPLDAEIVSVAGKVIYAGLIDAYVADKVLSDGPPSESKRVGEEESTARPKRIEKLPGDSHELPWVHPDEQAVRQLMVGTKALAAFRAAGFVAANVVPSQGIFRGTAVVMSLGSGPVNDLVLRADSAQVVSFSGADGVYPSSLMGVVAVIRQTLLDARWYRDAHRAFGALPEGRQRPTYNRALAALDDVVDGRMPVLFDVESNPLGTLRAARIAAEQHLIWWVVASGAEYRRLDEVSRLGVPVIVPVDFPPPPAVEDDDHEWALVSTDELRHWDRAPHNPAWLVARGVKVALTGHRLDSPRDLLAKVRMAIEAGLDHDDALAALTTVPAGLLGVDRLLGTIAPGKAASLIVADGDLFGESTHIDEVWIDGLRYPTEPPPKPREVEAVGIFHIDFDLPAPRTVSAVLEITRAGEGLGGQLIVAGDPQAIPLDCVEAYGNRLWLGFAGDRFDLPGPLLVAVTLSDRAMAGALSTPDGKSYRWSGEREDVGRSIPPLPTPPPAPVGGPILQPAVVVVQGATLWTEAAQGRLETGDLLVRDGRIAAVSHHVPVPSQALVIDARGKHVTPGLIDAHSHTAIDGDVNEGTRSVTAEVRIGDVVDSEDWNIYSELAGGLTTVNQLHGSANAIGGQSQTIKLRWGASPEGLKLEGAKPGIKFALGENVKQSNWGDGFTERYPQTRLGVEQTIRERFLAARDYLARWDAYRRKSTSDGTRMPPRTDLQLATIAEILRGERLIHCHSYRQDEILMLIRLMDEFGVTIGTFQHVLEGYKVADEIAAHGAGASTFTDWWAYKFEVYDAIPYNGALMWDRGVVVSFNSDSNELARRLAVEAAKAVKYGGVDAIEALKMVTINPARQLRVEHRIGSLEVGKDADFVIWNGDPLSTMTLAEQTWIDGKKYFDRSVDLERRAGLAKEREGLIQRAKRAPKHTTGKADGGVGR